MCQVVEQTSAFENESAAKAQLTAALTQFCDVLRDFDASEVKRLLHDEEVVKLFVALGIDVVELAQSAEALFPKNAKCNFQTFIQLLMQLRSSAYTTGKDLCSLKGWLYKELHDSSRRHKKTLQALLDTLTHLSAETEVLWG